MDLDEDPRGAHAGPRAHVGWIRAVVVAATVGGGLALGALLSQAIEPECRELPREDLTIVEMGQLRRVVDRYKADPAVPMRLTPRQASFLLREEFELPVWVNVIGAEVTFESRVPRFGRCWSVSFDGDLSISDGVATVVPRTLVIGHLALTPVLTGWPWTVIPAQLQLPRARELLGHVVDAHVEDEQIVVSVDDPGWLR